MFRFDFWMIKTQSRDLYAAGDTFVSSFCLVSVRGSHKSDVTNRYKYAGDTYLSVDAGGETEI